MGTAAVRTLRRRLAQLARDVASTIRGHDLVLLAAGLTFYAAISVVPLLLIAIWLAGLVLGPDTVARLVSTVAGYVPEPIGIRSALHALTDAGSRLGLMSVLAALIPATTYGEGLTRALARLDDREVARAASVWGRLRSLTILATLPVVVLAGLLAVAILPQVLGVGEGARLLGVYLTFVVGWLSWALLLAVVYLSFGNALRGRSVLWGALSAGSFLCGMSLGWVLFLRFNPALGRAYGGSEVLGGLVLAVLYLFLVQLVLLVGYAVILQVEARRGHPLRHPETPRVGRS